MIITITFWPDKTSAPIKESYVCNSHADEESIPYDSYPNIISVEETTL